MSGSVIVHEESTRERHAYVADTGQARNLAAGALSQPHSAAAAHPPRRGGDAEDARRALDVSRRRTVIGLAVTLGLFLAGMAFLSNLLLTREVLAAGATIESAMEQVRLMVYVLTGILFTALVLGLVIIDREIARRVSHPALELSQAAEAIAAGDLTVTVDPSRMPGELGRLARAVVQMIEELHSLGTTLRGASTQTKSMSVEITAGAEEMAAAAGEIASTASDLSHQANTMAQTITRLTGAAEHLMPVAESLDHGVHEGVARNATLRELALANRARLDESTTALVSLSTDVSASSQATEALAKASEEVVEFVTLVRKLARQSKLLALNAAMEAARAGEHGHGFAVVAEEVRRLAVMSNDAAEKTQSVVQGVLDRIEETRASTSRTVDTVRTVRDSTQLGARSFEQIETAVAELEGWTGSIEKAATAATQLVRDMTGQLATLSQGTETFAAAMEEVAASSQEQSASTEEIAGAASTLAHAADRLSGVVSNLKLRSEG